MRWAAQTAESPEAIGYVEGEAGNGGLPGRTGPRFPAPYGDADISGVTDFGRRRFRSRRSLGR